MAFECAMAREELIAYVDNQLKFFTCSHSVKAIIDETFEKVAFCFSRITNKYYRGNGGGYFSPTHSAQYGQFLYFLSRVAFEHRDIELAEKVYYLNKMLNAVDLFYEVELPNVFFADHPVGAVMGRANYGNYFFFSQNCTVGNNHDQYPTFGENVVMHTGSIVVGSTLIGNNVEISVGAFIRDETIPDNSLVFGQSPNLRIVRRTEEQMEKRLIYFRL